MPRDSDKNNDSRGRRDRPSGGKGRSGAARGPEKKFAKRGFAGKSDGDGEKRPYAGKPDGAKSYGKKPYSGPGKPYAGRREGPAPRRDDGDARPARFNRDDRPARGASDRPDRKDFRPREDRGGEKRPYTPRGDARPAARFADRKFGDKKPYASREGGGEKRPYTPRGEGFRKDGDRPRGDRPYSARPPRDGDRPRGDRPERKFGGDKKFSTRGAPDRGPRKERGKDFGADRGNSKPWQKRDASSPDHAGRNSRPPREGARSFDKPREDRPSGDRPFRERPKFARPREDRPKFERPRRESDSGARNDWQEHPRGDAPSYDRNAERPRRDNEDDAKVFAKRPAFGGRGAYRERTPDERRTARPPREKKTGERIAKVVSRAGLASRRDAEEWIVQGRVTVN
ncbi:MAG TPA: S4 domain-containing protein, partial [Methylocella sp.]